MRFDLRPYREGDTPALVTLFRETIHSVNRRDYNPAQLAAWAPAEIDEAVCARPLPALRTGLPYTCHPGQGLRVSEGREPGSISKLGASRHMVPGSLSRPG